MDLTRFIRTFLLVQQKVLLLSSDYLDVICNEDLWASMLLLIQLCELLRKPIIHLAHTSYPTS